MQSDKFFLLFNNIGNINENIRFELPGDAADVIFGHIHICIP